MTDWKSRTMTGKRMRPDDAADDVMRVLDGRHPVAHRFVDGVAQRAAAASHGNNLGSHCAHLEDVELLAAHVLLAHVDLTFEAEEGRGRRGGDAVLPGAGLGDDAWLAHAFRQKRLADAVVDLVGAGVVEVLALQQDAGAAGLGGEALSEVQRRRPRDVLGEAALELTAEAVVSACRGVLLGQLAQGEGERLGDVEAAVGPESAVDVGDGKDVGSHGASSGWSWSGLLSG
jgi:hypothetical protein